VTSSYNVINIPIEHTMMGGVEELVCKQDQRRTHPLKCSGRNTSSSRYRVYDLVMTGKPKKAKRKGRARTGGELHG
jgi:hypothetical protein